MPSDYEHYRNWLESLEKEDNPDPETLDYVERLLGKFELERLGCEVIEIECLFNKGA